MNENNSTLIALSLYDIFLVFLLLPAMTFFVQYEYNSDINANVDMNSSAIYGNTTTQFEANTGTIGFFKALYITITVEIPWWAHIIFVLIPNIILGMIIYDKLRGI